MPTLDELNAYLVSIGMAPVAVPPGVDPTYNPNPEWTVTGEPTGLPPTFPPPLPPSLPPSGPVPIPAATVDPVSVVRYETPLAAFIGGVMPVVIPISQLLKLIPFLMSIPAFAAFIRSLVTKSVTSWDMLPGWLKVALLAGGVAAGTALLHDLLTRDGTGQVPAGFSESWIANGVQFYRNPNGMLGVMNSKGRWKQWRPKRPIVIFAGGASSIRTMLKADAALDRQSKALAKVLRRRVPQRRASGERAIIASLAHQRQLGPG